MNTKTEPHVFQKRPDEQVPDTRLLLLKLRLFMGLKTWAALGRVVGVPEGSNNLSRWAKRDVEKRHAPSIKYLLKALDATLDHAAQRERAKDVQIAQLKAHINNKTIPCDICPMAGYALSQSMARRPEVPRV